MKLCQLNFLVETWSPKRKGVCVQSGSKIATLHMKGSEFLISVVPKLYQGH